MEVELPTLRNLDVEFVSLVDRAAVRNPTDTTEPQRFLLWKRESGEIIDAPDEGGTMSDELSAALAKAEQAETERDELTKRVEALESDLKKAAEAAEAAKPAEPVEIDKSELPEAVREALEKAEARAADADARIEKAEKIAKEERDQRILREFVAKAEAMPRVAGDPTEFGPVLKAAAESLTTEEFSALEARLTAADEQIKAGSVFSQIGKSGDGERDGDGDLTRKAEELRKADGNLNSYQALRQAARGEAGERYLQSVR